MNNEVKRNAFSKLADITDNVKSTNSEFILTNLFSMIKSNSENADLAGQCINNIISKDEINQYDLILDAVVKEVKT